MFMLTWIHGRSVGSHHLRVHHRVGRADRRHPGCHRVHTHRPHRGHPLLTSLVHPEKQKRGSSFEKRPTGPVASFRENSFLGIEWIRASPLIERNSQ